MKKTVYIFMLIVTLSSISACSNQDIGTVGGATLGGLAGYGLTGGSVGGTAVGAIGGGLIGNAVSR